MPTAPKLIAAILFAALTWFVTDLVKPLLPVGTQMGLLSPINAVIGAFFGWRVIGARAGHSLKASLGYGITTAAIIVFWCLLFWSAYRMTIQSTRMRYDGPIDALQDMFFMMFDYARLMFTGEIMGSLAIGALVFGWLTEQVARRYS
jgi:hypothetical protein